MEATVRPLTKGTTMAPRQCPYCELRFASGSELEAHVTHDHPHRIHPGFPSTVHEFVARDEELDQDEAPVPRTWEEARQMTAEFEALLRRYHGDFQRAVDAQRRGERADTHGTGMSNPM
jgi:hypothetical protein